MPKRSKLYRAQLERFDKLKRYSLAEAAALLKELPSVKFDQTVEIAFKLGVDPKQTDQTVRGAVALPRGTGKEVRVVVIADDDKFRQEAEAAGANVVGFEDVISKIKGGWLDFDVLIATPSSMSQIRPLGRPNTLLVQMNQTIPVLKANQRTPKTPLPNGHKALKTSEKP